MVRGQADFASRPTIRDVAERAGVAPSTASLVFSGRGPVADATAQRVRAAASELGYAGPDPRAASLRSGRAGAVGVLVEGRLLQAFRDPYAVIVLDGLAQELDAIPTGMLLVAQPFDEPERAMEVVTGLAIDAFVFSMCGPAETPVVDHLATRGIPMLGTGAPSDDRVHQVLIDEAGAQGEIVHHLRDLGHRRIGHVTMPMRPVTPGGKLRPADLERAEYVDSRERARGFLATAGRRSPMVEAATADVEGGIAAARVLLDRSADTRPTAVAAQSDLLAAGVIQVAGELGLRVPDDLSVTGFDGVSLPWLATPLTTIDQHGEQKGRALGRLVARLIGGDGGGEVENVTIPTDLRVGGTTGPPPRP
ncbi:MAG TPA: LacI family DNA-binding transcriptional regulator [Nocardioidaceae bacterium]|nr:LacI family DNA-binding transcriptional regulator [Nocardioidaceae bacterium]